jgi:hypothetical protein
MKHKHAEFIHLMADGVRIETRDKDENLWIMAYWGDFNASDLEFRIAPGQPADEEGWIPWFGGENPAVEKRVDFKCRDGGISVSWASSTCLAWNHNGGVGDIVAYRIVKQVKKWRWMFLPIAERNCASLPQLTPYFATEEEARRWCSEFQKLGPRQDWTEVCDE